MTQGQGVYHLPGDGPATHMYGPLTTLLHAGVVECVGPTRLAARLVSLHAAAASVALMLLTFCRNQRWPVAAAGAVLVAADFFRTRATYTEVRPDALAAFFSLAALLALAAGHRRGRWSLTLLGTLLTLTAFGFKQAAAAVAAVPMHTFTLPREWNFTIARVADGSAAAPQIVERVRRLPGRVVTPEDPLIAFFASGFAGRNFACEMDTTGNRVVPEAMTRELLAARWIVRVHASYELKRAWDMERLGFRRVDDAMFGHTVYSLWVRSQSGATTRETRDPSGLSAP